MGFLQDIPAPNDIFIENICKIDNLYLTCPFSLVCFSFFLLYLYSLLSEVMLDSNFIIFLDYGIFLVLEGEDCLKRIRHIPTFTLDTTFTPEDERNVLLDIFASTNGREWFNKRGWNSSAEDVSHCSWYGITCHNSTSYITAVVLAYNNLDGSLPPNLWKIRNLLSLCTPGNPSQRNI